MLDQSLKEQLLRIFEGLEASYVFDISADPGNGARGELLELLEETAACSERISCRIGDGEGLQFRILRNGEDLGIRFRAVPNGHEFSSLLLAVLNADGKGKNLPDASTRRRIEALDGQIDLTTYMSLTCTNCPDVVQALDLIAILNPRITHTVVDGALYQDEVARLGIQAVPAVFSGDEVIHIGRGTLAELLDKLEQRFGASETAAAPIVREYDLLVAGGGPAGASAAIYAARKGLRVAVVAEKIGGQVNETVGIENLISVPHTTGATLAADLRRHMETYGIDICDNRRIERFGMDGGIRELHVKRGETFRAPALIIATGASWRRLGVPGESEYIGRGVAFCPHCDGPFYAGRHVAVIGGGNSGVEAAIDLAGICASVTVLEFMETLKADQVLQDKLRTLPNVEVHTNIQTLEVQGDGSRMTALRIKDRATGEERLLTLDGIFVQIGLSANSSLFAGTLATNRAGEIVTDKDGRTSVSGIYGAGDVTDVRYEQIVIAMGEGAKAALAVSEDRIKGII